MQLRMILLQTSKTTLFILQYASTSLLIFITINKSYSAQTCIETSRICTQGAETRVINGESIYKDCWAYDIVYNCYDATTYTDNCTYIKSINTCSQLSSQCQANLESGNCITYKNNFLCSLPIDNYELFNLTLEGHSQVITSEYLDDSACNTYSLNSQCILSSPRICIDDSLSVEPTKTINGLDIVRDCWNYQETYSCASGNDECTDLENNSDCTYSSEECLSKNSQGICTYLTKSYQCSITISSDTKLTCNSQTYCIGEDCNIISYQQDQNFGKASANLSMLQDASLELSEDLLSTLTGEGKKCSKDLLDFNDCCDMSGWNDSFIAEGLTFSPGFSIIEGEVISLSSLIASCSTQEKELAFQRANRKCVYIGSHCSKEIDLDFDEICIEKKQAHCCFKSRLSRIIHEQGRSQLGKSWGSPKAPNCSGLTIDELQNIDFSQIDFSEIVAEFEAKADQNTPSNAAIAAQVQQAITDYYEGGENE